MLAAQAAARITGGRVEGCEEGSKTLTYLPGRIRAGRYFFELSTAGAVSLVLQTVLAPLAFASEGSSITLSGGTHVPWSPTTDYIEEVFLPALSAMGLKASLTTLSRGYYPSGGGKAESRISRSKVPLDPFRAAERGALTGAGITSAVSNLPLSIAERQLRSALSVLSGLQVPVETELKEAASPGVGTSIFITAEFENCRAGFSALGARGKKAEAVGAEAALAFIRHVERKGAIDPHLADQVPVYMALARGESAFTTSEVTGHLLTNVHVIEKFLAVKFNVEGESSQEGSVSVKGAGFTGERLKG